MQSAVPQMDSPSRGKIGCKTTRDVYPPEAESASFKYKVPPWAESYEISAMEVEGASFLLLKVV